MKIKARSLIVSSRLLAAVFITFLIILLLLNGCAGVTPPSEPSSYDSEDLANKWRSNYSSHIYPRDNDNEYYYPTHPGHPVPRPYTQPNYPPPTAYPSPYGSPYGHTTPPSYPRDHEADYYSPHYPRYNPNVDNPSPQQNLSNDEEYYYPLFFDE